MKTGTKSVLFGAHQFLLHPIFVAIAWIKLYGFPFDPRIWFAFFVHDLGYWGKPNMDGPEGEEHPIFGAKIMHFLFDRYEYKDEFYPYTDILSNNVAAQMLQGWEMVDELELHENINVMYRRRKTTWYEFTLYHSRYMSKRLHAQPSRLCYADKYAFCITIPWLYLWSVQATGEVQEYMTHTHQTDIHKWYTEAKEYLKNYVLKHKDGKVHDTWTKTTRHEEYSTLREETYSNEYSREMTRKLQETKP